MKLRAQVRRLPKLIERVKALEDALQAKPAALRLRSGGAVLLSAAGSMR